MAAEQQLSRAEAGTAEQPGSLAHPASAAWRSLRSGGDLQFGPIQPKIIAPSPPPPWLQALGRILEALFRPLARALGIGWPVMQGLLIAAGALVLALLAWWLGAQLLAKARKRKPAAALEWAPDRADAAALLEDADRLAAQGHYDEAAHLLLRRSCNQIRDAHPNWLHPASTAREIAGLAALPEQARAAFAVIADRVEASRYALRALIEADWQVARAAYAQFALHGAGVA